jgi:MGT family glycosyltransferase
MARVILATSPEKGHINPMVGVAQHLGARGHQVKWLCVGRAPAQLRSLGVEVLEVPGAEGTPLMGAEMAGMIRDPARLRAWVGELLLGAVPRQVEPIRAHLREAKADVVATDPMLYGVVIAAAIEGIRWAGISSSLNPVAPPDLDTPMKRTVEDLAPQREALFGAHGLRYSFRLCDCLSPDLNTVFATRELVGDALLPPATFLVGPSRFLAFRGDEPAFDLAGLRSSQPLILCSFGSQISWQPLAFGKLAAAALRLGAQLVINGGPESARQTLKLPGDPIVQPYLPQPELLRRARVLVSHGGANSVMEALLAGVPLLLNPLCNDQPTQAWFVRRAGLGRIADLERASQTELEQALAGRWPRPINARMAQRKPRPSWSGWQRRDRLEAQPLARGRRPRFGDLGPTGARAPAL